MTGYQSKKTAALDEDGMYLVHHTAQPEQDAMQSLKDLKRSVCDEVGKAAFAQPEQELWCMKMNGCTTKCDDCPDEAAQPAQEPPPWWPAVENILTEYGLQAIDFVADFNAAMKDAAQRQWVGIPEEDLKQGDESFYVAWREGARWAEAYLKKKNGLQ